MLLKTHMIKLYGLRFVTWNFISRLDISHVRIHKQFVKKKCGFAVRIN